MCLGDATLALRFARFPLLIKAPLPYLSCFFLGGACLSILGGCVKCDMQDGLSGLPLVVARSKEGEKAKRMMVE